MSLHVGYERAQRCSSGPTPGAKALMSWYLGAYSASGGRNLGIYNCRTVVGGSTLSLHGEGRACDLGLPVGAAWGWTLARALVAYSAELGVQCVIYDRKIWSGSYPTAGWRDYHGTNAHRDHLHVELSRNGASTLTAQRVQLVLGGSKPPPSATPTIRRGSTGPAVTNAQNRLTGHAFTPGTADGIFGTKTEAAVRKFQGSRKLAVDGVVGPRTWAELLKNPVKLPTHRATIKRGSKGPAVRDLQEKLRRVYPAYAGGLAVDSDFGPKTEAAVREFQSRAGLAVDGIVGRQTWARLGF